MKASLGLSPDEFPDSKAFDREIARREGWILSECSPDEQGRSRVQIRKFDAADSPRFREDRDAWAHVVGRARAGSLLHRRALDLIDPRERMAILASYGPW